MWRGNKVNLHKNITTVLFDLDGTIADTNELIMRTMAETLEHATGRAWRREELLPNWGLILRRQLRLCHPQIDLERAIPFYRQRYAKLHGELLAEFPGVRELLECLREGGFKLGVVTSKKRSMCLLTMDDLQLTKFFPVIIAEEDVLCLKPAPEPLLLALERLQSTPQQALYVGDNPDDLIAAHAAGMRAVAVGWSLRPREDLLAEHPDALIDAPSDLLSLLPAPAPIAVT